MSEVDGATLLARSLKQQGVDYLFGVVGFPVTPIADAAQKVGIPYIGMRNEQAASYAAQAFGYLTGRPGACIVVTGPGVIHGLAGLANAQQNCWPMILIGGASETYRNGMGAFQEERQVLIATPFCKYAHAIEPSTASRTMSRWHAAGDLRPPRRHLSRLPRRHHHRHVRPRQGHRGRARARAAAHAGDRQRTSSGAGRAANGPAPARADRPGHGLGARRGEVRKFMERTQIPFVRTPKGKGVMPDDHPLSAGAARTLALQQADVVFLMGARFNWILHFGLAPR